MRPPQQFEDFLNWLTDTEAIQRALDRIVEGLLFDVIHNASSWFSSWGEKPETVEAQKAKIQSLVAAAPRLVPISSCHRFLLAEPCQMGNPVFSIHQSDIVVYAPDLRSYFLKDFSELVDVDDDEWQEFSASNSQLLRERWASYKAIPFWGEFLSLWIIPTK